jgi:anaerobic magnesium-protoporphyrin IX monomethyl ester cyclase
MSVLLVHIPVGFEEAYPLGLAAIAAPLCDAGYTVDGLDVGRVGTQGLLSRLDRGDVDVVGIGVWTPGAPKAKAVVDAIRQAPQSPTIVVGGPHATLAPGDVDADVSVVGEGEQTFLDVVEALAADRGLDRISGTVVSGSDHEPLDREWADLDTLPMPDRTAFTIQDYHREHMPRGKRYASVYTSRGCRYRCRYCSSPFLWGQIHRFRSPEQVVSEWRKLRVDHGVDSVLIEDDLFSQDRERVSLLCEALIREAPGVTWELLNGIRPDSVDNPLLALMARAGCTRIAFGIEAAGSAALKHLGRSPDLAHIADVVRAAHASGMSTTGYFMIGLPGETDADRRDTFELSTSLDLDFAHFCTASAWPGTRWSEEELAELPSRVRAGMYRRWYLHPKRARRVMRAMGVGWTSLPNLIGRLARWTSNPIEARRSSA